MSVFKGYGTLIIAGGELVEKKKTKEKKDFVPAHEYMQMYGEAFFEPDSNVRMRSDDAVLEGKEWVEYNAS